MSRSSSRTLTSDDTRQTAALVGQSGLTVVALLTSAGTLVCCALPILLVSLGLGAAVAGLTSNLPWLVALSQHKTWIFSGSLLLLIVSGLMIRRSARRCPTEPRLAQLCARVSRINRWILASAGAIWVAGFFTAFLLLPLQRWIGA